MSAQLRTQTFTDLYSGERFEYSFDPTVVTTSTRLPVGIMVKSPSNRYFLSYLDAHFQVRGQEKVELAGAAFCEAGCQCKCPSPLRGKPVQGTNPFTGKPFVI